MPSPTIDTSRYCERDNLSNALQECTRGRMEHCHLRVRGQPSRSVSPSPIEACKVLIEPGSLLSLLRTIYQSADEASRQMRPAQWFTTMNTHHNPSLNTGTNHSNNQDNQEREVPPRLEEVNLEDISIHFLCICSTHPNWKQIVSSRNDYGQTMAHISVALGYFRLLQHLSTWQIDLDIVDHMGSTALHYAYLFIQEECARLLIHSGAERFILDDLGRSPSSLNPSLEVRLRPSVEIGGDSSTRSTSPADFTIEMPEEAEGLYAKYFLVQQWTRRIEGERMSEKREMSPPRRRRNDAWGHSTAASSAPINHSAEERVGRVVERLSFSSIIQSSQGIPTLVAVQQVETVSDTVFPSGVLSPPTRTSDQAKVNGPGQIYEGVGSQDTAAGNARSLSRETGNPQEGRHTLIVPFPVPGTLTSLHHTTQPPLTSRLIRESSALTQDIHQPSEVAQNLESFVSHRAPLGEDSYSAPVEVVTVNPSDIIISSSPPPAPEDGCSSSKHRESLKESLLPTERSPRVPQPNITEKPGTQVDPKDEYNGFVSVNQPLEVQKAMRDLVVAIRTTQFFIDNKLEPCLGSSRAAALMAVAPDELWSGFGTKGMSIYSLFIKVDGEVCECLWCGHVQDGTLQHAISHFRAKHLGHKPYLCGDIHVGNEVW